MTTAPSRLGLPQLSVSDAYRIGQLADEATAGLEHALSEIRCLLQQRDLVALWDDEQGSFRSEFIDLAARYHAVQRALCELNRESFSWQHDLSSYVSAQR
jgi:hypothetical protein